ncbi:YesL family protein [[Clostridium] fimetarium]|uniref:Uncharacterized membrane protein YesL n=1 Tax=[Clostridium] fimetarium TaxID=99656 RepID=A0A1I0M4V0_9FIRM|nr:DUF624 domain-containing protein [[Clostridium] fimetarium]SEV82800.1 Uncharacterized membrane protein YesL [[Clostridium] fimetarium]
MGKFFSIEGRFFGGMTRVADFIILDILVMIFSIPIITIGPALSAGYYVALKEVKNQEGYVVKSFIKAFKQNFLQGFIIELITFGAAGLLYFDLSITYKWAHSAEQSLFANLLFFVLLGFLVIVFAIVIYIFPMLAKFDNKTIKLIINSMVMAMKHLPQTIIMVIINGYLVYLTFTYPPFIIFSIGISLYITAYIMTRIFNIYTKPKEKEDESDAYHIDMY